jgi:hypothetical protein
LAPIYHHRTVKATFRAWSVYAAAEKKSPGTYAARSSRSGMLAINRPSVSRSIIAQ